VKLTRPSVGLILAKSKSVITNKESIHRHRQSLSSAAQSVTAPTRNIKNQTNQRINTDLARKKAVQPVSVEKKENPSKSYLDQASSNKIQGKRNYNENFVRLNLRNNAGACRGARNKKTKRRWKSRKDREREIDYKNGHSNQRDEDVSDDDVEATEYTENTFNASTGKSAATSYVSKMNGLDPLDEFMDGTFRASNKQSDNSSAANDNDEAPKCARHQRPCKLITVRKNTTGNKGRKFYACSMPRGEQCNHFQWADDTVEAARKILAKNKHHSSFISRQVAEHVARFRVLTVPELREEATRRKLNKVGKKQELLMRLAIWTRDAIVTASPHLEQEEDCDSKKSDVRKITMDSLNDLHPDKAEDESFSDDDVSSASSSDDELEFENMSSPEDAKEETTMDGPPTDTCSESSNPGSWARDKSLSDSLCRIFGHKSFRTGQEWAVQRCLDGKRSLLVAPTGFGKSLCYALPAALMDGVCIVVSPLISLIHDQLRSLPPGVPAATLSGSVSASKSAAILDDIVRKRLKILFVSPERLTSSAFRRLFNFAWDPEKKTKQRVFPEISLLCIDEAHCISQWAHNFRPCFLRFRALLRLMQPKSILGITATAGPSVVEDVRETLGIPCANLEDGDDDESIKIVRSCRDNIDVKVRLLQNQEERLETLVQILTPNSREKRKSNGGDYAGELSNGSVIVYVWRQKDTEVVAEYLNAAGVPGGVVIYHGGMDASARAKSQSNFMRGKARVCVATVAFGLGIDKSDIVGIVHMYLSNSPEHYLQEIGRAGRDGRKAIAIALPLAEEVPVRHSLSHSNLITKDQVGSLLRKLKRLVEAAVEAIGSGSSETNRSFHIALPVQETVMDCDCKQETVETILSLIERSGGDSPLLRVEGLNYDKATIAMKKRSLKKLAEKEEVASCIHAVCECLDPPIGTSAKETAATLVTHAPSISFQKHFLAYSMGAYSFSIAKCANRLGSCAEPRHIFAALRRLQSCNELELHLDTSEKGRIFHLKITELGARIFASSEYEGLEEKLTDEIQRSFKLSSNGSADKVLDMHFIMHQVADATASAGEVDGIIDGKSRSLLQFQELMHTFFAKGLEEERNKILSELLPASFYEVREKELTSDVRILFQELPAIYSEQRQNKNSSTSVEIGHSVDYTALAVSKFLHGIDSPRTPYLLCRNHPMFGKWKYVNFETIHEAVCKTLNS
jgi:ATP-dependent DNA helicase Q4